MEITHFFHDHPLTLWEEDAAIDCGRCGKPGLSPITGCSTLDIPYFYCDACGMRQRYPHDPFYYCNTCWKINDFFTVHKSCIELPQEIHLFVHPNHSLIFLQLSQDDDDDLKCHFCDSSLASSSFKCDQCSFGVDYKCASTFMYYHEGKDRIDNFIHRHPLAHLDSLVKDEDYFCKICGDDVNAPVYGCQPCEFYLHQSCFDEVIHQRIQHPFHPFHSLEIKESLYSNSSSQDVCKACGRETCHASIYYECENEVCDFRLHIRCATLMPNIKYKGHKHDFILIYFFGQIKCEGCCADIIRAYCARCVECDINYHVNCGSVYLPPTTKYNNHEHTLMLTEMSSFGVAYCCNICKKESRQIISYCYNCAECQYYADVGCVITELQPDERPKLEHFSHDHYLLCYENDKKNSGALCTACEEDIYDTTPAYCCYPCKFYIHKSCTELQTEILQHPLHPDHPLTLPTAFSAKQSHCSACNKQFNGFTYQCSKDCNFGLDINCTKLYPSIKQDQHEHKLTFIEKIYDNPRCVACTSYPSNVAYLRCVTCDFNIHLLCSPLPSTIQHVSHKEHSLTLMDYVAEYENDEFCDYCEERIHPKECVYGCEECHLMVDYKCVIKQVLCLLAGNQGVVKLRTVDRKKFKKIKEGLSCKEVFVSLNIEEQKQLYIIASYLNEDINHEFNVRRDSITKHLSTLEEMILYLLIRSISSKSFDTFGDYSKFVTSIFENSSYDKFSRSENNPQRCVENMLIKDLQDEEIVSVGDYKTVESLAPILKNLLKRCPSIVADCCLTSNIFKTIVLTNCLTSNIKTIVLTNLCATLRTMSKIKVEDVNLELLHDWWRCFKIAEVAGCKVQFLIDHLKKLMHARFEVTQVSQRNETLCQLHENMTRLSQEMKEANKKIRRHIESSPHAIAKIEKERLLEGLELRRGTAIIGLLDIDEDPNSKRL